MRRSSAARIEKLEKLVRAADATLNHLRRQVFIRTLAIFWPPKDHDAFLAESRLKGFDQIRAPQELVEKVAEIIDSVSIEMTGMHYEDLPRPTAEELWWEVPGSGKCPGQTFPPPAGHDLSREKGKSMVSGMKQDLKI